MVLTSVDFRAFFLFISHFLDIYQNPGDDFEQSFAQIGEGPISAKQGRTDIIVWQNPTYHWLGTWYPHGTGLGSLTLGC